MYCNGRLLLQCLDTRQYRFRIACEFGDHQVFRARDKTDDAVKYLNSFQEFCINPRYQKPSANPNDITCSRLRLQFAPRQSTIIVHLTFFAHWSIIISNRGLKVNESCLTITNDCTNLLLGREPDEQFNISQSVLNQGSDFEFNIAHSYFRQDN